jgi:GxxExxY protein
MQRVCHAKGVNSRVEALVWFGVVELPIRITRMNPDETRPKEGSSRRALLFESLTREIIGGLYHVHNSLGFGFVESVYARSMEVTLCQRGLKVEREIPIEVVFEGVEVGRYRIDMLVENKIILEIKASEKLTDVPKIQLRNYLAAAKLELGLVLHFGPRASFYRVLAPQT